MGLMVREIRNTGLKVYLTGTGPFAKVVANDIIIDNNDSSSFEHRQSGYGEFGDTLKIKKIMLNRNGDYVSSDTSSTFYLDGTTLKWELKTDAGNLTTSVIAENVHALQFEYGIIASNSQLFDEDPITVADWNLTCASGPNPNMSGATEITLGFTGAGTGYLTYNYLGFGGYQVEQNQKYRVTLDITPGGGFPDALDYLSIAFKDINNVDLGSEQFLPYSGKMEITVPIHTSGNAYPTLEYKTTGAGSLKIKGIEAHCTQNDIYSWSFNPGISDKKFVRAIRAHILTRTRGKTNRITDNGPVTVGDVQVPRMGGYTWRLYTETIETPNNGVF
jgi:hypothetical protein